MYPRSVLFITAACALLGQDKPGSTLQAVNSIFVSGNNQAAEHARDVLRAGKTCFMLAPKQDDADAVLAIEADTRSQGGRIGGLGGRSWIASGTLTLKSGELAWSKSERFSDAPFKSGGKTAGELLVKRLAKDAQCGRRPR